MSEQRIIVLTGAQGYLGRKLIPYLAQTFPDDQILALDIREAQDDPNTPNVKNLVCDITTDKIKTLIKENKTTHLIHLACAVPGKKPLPRELEYKIDVRGTKNILEALRDTPSAKQFIVTSSGAAYGYHPDHPEYISEERPLRGNQEWSYSYHKHLVEEMLAEYRKSSPELKQLILRPGTILGKTTDNQITKLFNWPFVLGIKGSDSPFCFIWDEDMVQIILEGVKQEVEGVYNISGNGKLSMRELATKMNKPYLNVPAKVLEKGLSLLKTLKLSNYGPEQVRFLRYRPVLSNDKLKQSFYTPQKTSEDVFDLYLASSSERTVS